MRAKSGRRTRGTQLEVKPYRKTLVDTCCHLKEENIWSISPSRFESIRVRLQLPCHLFNSDIRDSDIFPGRQFVCVPQLQRRCIQKFFPKCYAQQIYASLKYSLQHLHKPIGFISCIASSSWTLLWLALRTSFKFRTRLRTRPPCTFLTPRHDWHSRYFN